MRTRIWTTASEVRSHSDDGTGDFLPGLDNGYVVEVEENDGYFSYPGGGRVTAAMPDDTVLITFHDAQGDECYLLMPGDSQIQVER